MAVDYYRDVLFSGATFEDLLKSDGPLVLINTSDVGQGVRFTFAQEYFNLLCSDLSSFPVARAVTASSVVPVLFDPVVVENYPGCDKGPPPWLAAARIRLPDQPGNGRLQRGLHLLLRRCANLDELGRAFGAATVHAVQHEAVQVNIEVGGRPEALDQRDGTAAGRLQCPGVERAWRARRSAGRV